MWRAMSSSWLFTSIVSLAELIMEDNDLHLPQDPDEAKSLYLDLLYHIDNL